MLYVLPVKMSILVGATLIFTSGNPVRSLLILGNNPRAVVGLPGANMAVNCSDGSFEVVIGDNSPRSGICVFVWSDTFCWLICSGITPLVGIPVSASSLVSRAPRFGIFSKIVNPGIVSFDVGAPAELFLKDQVIDNLFLK